MQEHILVAILKKGIKLKDLNKVGYTKNQLEKIGLDKNHMNKAVKYGLVEKISVYSEDTPYAQTFYCVDLPPEEENVEINNKDTEVSNNLGT